MVDESREPPGKPGKAGVGMRSMKERGTNRSGIWLSGEFRGHLLGPLASSVPIQVTPNYIVR